MRLTKIALGVALGISGMAVVNAADVAMFPYVVSSPTVTTVVSVIDRGAAATKRYDINGQASATGKYLHWRLHYKEITAADGNNGDKCKKVEQNLPTSANDIQTVDLSGGLSNDGDGGVLFESPGLNNNWQGSNYDLFTKTASENPMRGVLFVNNSDETEDYATTRGTVRGEAMIFEFQSGAAWGYSAEVKDGGAVDDATDFSFTDRAAASDDKKPWPLIAFMPVSEVVTKLFVTPVDDWREGMLGQGGSDADNWDGLTATVGIRSGAPMEGPGSEENPVGVAFNRDAEPVLGAKDVSITCVGSVSVTDLMTEAAKADLADGGYGLLSIVSPYTDYNTGQPGHAIVYKLEYAGADGTDGNFNGQPMEGVFNNALKL